MYVAQDQGFFRRYGLELTFVQVRNGPIGMAALAGGESQLHEGSVTGAVLGSAAEGTDLVFVAGMINKLIGNIMASPKIKSPSDLKGKAIAVTKNDAILYFRTGLAFSFDKKYEEAIDALSKSVYLKGITETQARAELERVYRIKNGITTSGPELQPAIEKIVEEAGAKLK